MRGLNSKTLLITGGTGFVGKSLLDHLNSVEHNHVPTVFINSRSAQCFSPTEWKNLKIELLNCDLRNLRMRSLPPISHVIHAATSTDTKESMNIDYLYETIYLGTKNLLMECENNRPQHLLYVSSGAVYGKQSFEIDMHEELQLGPPTDDLTQVYGHFKRMGEMLVKDFYTKTNIPSTVARLFAFSGERMAINSPFAITDFVRDALNNKKIIVKGDGLTVRSYMSSKNLSEWLFSIIQQNKFFDIVNIGSNKKITIKSLAEIISRKTNCPFEILNLDEKNSYYVPNVDKAKKKYGLKLDDDLEQTIESMIETFKTKIFN